jgi:hypothetical protein
MCGMAPASDDDRPLSVILDDLARSPAKTVTLGELSEALGPRALASLILVFGLACTLPLPPGGTTIFGLPLVLLAPQLMLRAGAPWTPERMRGRRISMTQVRPVFVRMVPWLQRMEAVSRPRLGFLLDGAGRRLIGLICTVFAIVLILPIPLGNMLPAAAVSVFSLALVQRDGLVALAGYVLSAASVGVLVLAAHIVADVVGRALSALPIS